VTRLRQAGIVLVGLGLAAAMVVLGLWQLNVYQSQGSRTAAERVAAPPLDLQTVAPAGVAVTQGFGRTVTFSGRYDPSLQILVATPDDPARFRVLSGLRQSDGSIVPVVRGVTSSANAGPPPAGQQRQEGVLLPSEENAPDIVTPPDQLDAVRLPELAQRWDGQLIGGFVTLSSDSARAQGLLPAPLNLPAAKGRLRNAAYALQWWVFGAFAVAMAIRIARDAGRRDELDDLDALEITADTSRHSP
jgi:surfeit locus 1 family protein